MKHKTTKQKYIKYNILLYETCYRLQTITQLNS